MYLVSDFTKQSYKVNEVAKLLNVSTKTIRKYDAQGILQAKRTVGNHRVILREELLRFLNEKGLLLDNTAAARRDIVYARVLNQDQKNRRDLDRQALFIVEHVPDL
ncbi:MAG: helix-turn-helix domain-containing protein, partial [Desulfovibrio sp.]|nr:helix-turn-helix domain-containing protein [Desulfovibrio sp.]